MGKYCLSGVDDRHGGKEVSSFLKDRLAPLIESVTPEDIPSAIEDTVELGGYFRRWRGGALKRWTDWAPNGERAGAGETMTLDERLTLAFLKVSERIVVAGVSKEMGRRSLLPRIPGSAGGNTARREAITATGSARLG